LTSPHSFSLIKEYFPHISPEQEKQFLALSALYTYWNERINVISRKDIEELYLRHVLHSLAIARLIHFQSGSKIMDLGTGGGFPGIPLAILFPNVEFLLVDSIAKKIKVVSEVVGGLDLKNVCTRSARAEQVDQKFDFIVTRAVARSAKLRNWTKGKILRDNQHDLPNGIIALKGGDLTEELKEVKTKTRLFNITDFFDDPFFETKKVIWISK